MNPLALGETILLIGETLGIEVQRWPKTVNQFQLKKSTKLDSIRKVQAIEDDDIQKTQQIEKHDQYQLFLWQIGFPIPKQQPH